MVGVLSGLHRELEAKADSILAADRQGISSISDRRYWLSTDQWDLRHEREVLVPSPDPHYLRGTFGKVYNPMANHRPTNRRRFSREMDPWRQDAIESFGDLPGMYGAALPDNRPIYTYRKYRKMRSTQIPEDTTEVEQEPTTSEDVSANGSEPEEEEQFSSIPIDGLRKYRISPNGTVKNDRDHTLTPYQPNRNPNATWWITLNSRPWRIDKLVLTTFVGQPRGWRYGPRHRDGDPANCNLDNLEWEYGLGRKPNVPSPTKTKVPKAAKAAPTTKTVPTNRVLERFFLQAGDVTVMWMRSEGKVDISQMTEKHGVSTPIINDRDDVDAMIEVLQHIRDNR